MNKRKKIQFASLLTLVPLMLFSCGERTFNFYNAFKINDELNESTIKEIRLHESNRSIQPPSFASVYKAIGKDDIKLLSSFIKNSRFYYEEQMILPGSSRKILEIKTNDNLYTIYNLNYHSKTKFPELDFSLEYNYFYNFNDYCLNLYDEQITINKDDFKNYHFLKMEKDFVDPYDVTLDAYIETGNGFIFLEDAKHFIFNGSRYQIVGEEDFSKVFINNNDETCLVTIKDEFGEILATLKVSKNKVYSKSLLATMCKDYNYNLDLSEARKEDYSKFSEITFTQNTTLLII